GRDRAVRRKQLGAARDGASGCRRHLRGPVLDDLAPQRPRASHRHWRSGRTVLSAHGARPLLPLLRQMAVRALAHLGPTTGHPITTEAMKTVLPCGPARGEQWPLANSLKKSSWMTRDPIQLEVTPNDEIRIPSEPVRNGVAGAARPVVTDPK